MNALGFRVTALENVFSVVVFDTVISTIERPFIETSSDNVNDSNASNNQRSSPRQQFIVIAERYRVEDIEYFDSNVKEEKKDITSDVFVFTDRIKEIVDLKQLRLMQLNLRQNL
ncbi:MAG: hypothetical protein Q9191_008481 [Dirinaria sp. TL-2023a]